MAEIEELIAMASTKSPKKWINHLGDAFQGAKADTIETASFLMSMLEKLPMTTPEGKRFANKAQRWLESQWNIIPEDARDTLAFKIGSFLNPGDPLAWIPGGKLAKGGGKIAKAAIKGATKGGAGSFIHSYGEGKLRGASDEEALQLGQEAAPYGVGIGGVLGGIAGKLAKGKEQKALKLAERDPEVVKLMEEMLPNASQKLAQKYPGVLHHDPRGKELSESLRRGHASKKEMKALKALSSESEKILDKQTPSPENLVKNLLSTYQSRYEGAGNAYIPLWKKYSKMHGSDRFDELPLSWEIQQTLKSKFGKNFLSVLSEKETPTYGDLFFYGKDLESRIKKAGKAAATGTEFDRIRQNVVGKKRLKQEKDVINSLLKGMLDDPLLKEGDLNFAKDFGALKNNKIMQNVLKTEGGRKHAPKISDLFKEETEGIYDFLESLPEEDIKALYLAGLKIGDNKKIPEFVRRFVSPKAFNELKAQEGLKEVGKFYKETAGKAKPKTGARNQSFWSAGKELGRRLEDNFTPFKRSEALVYGPAKSQSKDPNQMEILEERKSSEKPSTMQILDLMNTLQAYKKDRRGNFQSLSEKLGMLNPEETPNFGEVKTSPLSRLLQEKQLDKTHKPKTFFVQQLLRNSPDAAMDILKSLTGNSNIRMAEDTLSYLESLPPPQKKPNLQQMEAIQNLYLQIASDPTQSKVAVEEMKKLLKLESDQAVFALIKNPRLLEKYVELKAKK